MRLLSTINPESASEGQAAKFILRRAVRAVVFDADGRIALLHVQKDHYHKLPGGGIEGLESNSTALQRECLEEIGCRIQVGPEIGETVEYWSKYNEKQISYCYQATVVGTKAQPSFTEEEMARGFSVKWVVPGDAIKQLLVDSPSDYEGRLIRERDLVFLQALQSL